MATFAALYPCGCTESIATVSQAEGEVAVPKPIAGKADRIVIEKAARKLHIVQNGKRVRTYGVSLGGNPEGHKQCEGDQRTPEGVYQLTYVNERSSYYRSVFIDYPNAADKAAAAERGCSPGGEIFIHGLPNGMGPAGKLYASRDWTLGCIAIGNDEIDELIGALEFPTPVEILP